MSADKFRGGLRTVGNQGIGYLQPQPVGQSMLSKLALGTLVGQRIIHPEAIHGVPQALHRFLSFRPGEQALGAIAQANTPLKLFAAPGEMGETEARAAGYMCADAKTAGYSLADAKAAGAKMVLDIQDQDYGGRGYTCKDLEGYVWSFGDYDPWAH